MTSLYQGFRKAFLATSRGKHIGEFSYFHQSLISDWSAYKSELEEIGNPDFNVVKLSRKQPKFSLLQYSNFDTSPFPVLKYSFAVHNGGNVFVTDYTQRSNPPILHRKELLLPADSPIAIESAKLTNTLEKSGLLKNAKAIGTLVGWNVRLKEAGFTLLGYELVNL